MDLGHVMQALYDSEINCEVSTFWDGGFTVRLGDAMNGFVAETEAYSAAEAAEWLDKAARQHFPGSTYVLGPEEWERRNQQRKDRHKLQLNSPTPRGKPYFALLQSLTSR